MAISLTFLKRLSLTLHSLLLSLRFYSLLCSRTYTPLSSRFHSLLYSRIYSPLSSRFYSLLSSSIYPLLYSSLSCIPSVCKPRLAWPCSLLTQCEPRRSLHITWYALGPNYPLKKADYAFLGEQHYKRPCATRYR